MQFQHKQRVDNLGFIESVQGRYAFYTAYNPEH
jgi:hypothetical protein